MIKICETVVLPIQTENGLDRILFSLTHFAIVGTVKGDVHFTEWKQPNDLIVNVVHGFRCPFCRKVFLVSEVEQLRHEECQQTWRYQTKIN